MHTLNIVNSFYTVARFQTFEFHFCKLILFSCKYYLVHLCSEYINKYYFTTFRFEKFISLQIVQFYKTYVKCFLLYFVQDTLP